MTGILYILEDSRFGGMSKMIADLAERMLESNFSPNLLIGEQNSSYFVSETARNRVPKHIVRLHILSKNKSAIARFLLHFIPDVVRIITVILKTKPKIVYCNGSQHIKGVIAAKLLGKKVIWHMHDTFQPAPVMTLFRWISATFRVDYFVASSERTIDFYNLPRGRTLLSRPPVDSEAFAPVNRETKFLRRKIQVISVANVNPDKGLDILIRAAAKVNENRNDVVFLIVGLIPDTQKQLYQQLLSLIEELQVDNVTFLGQRNDITTLLGNSDIYLCCSNNESGPISVFEAMSMEIPVISTDVGDLRKIFTINKSATVNRIGDYQGIANEIISTIENTEETARRSKGGRITVQEHLDIRIAAKKHLSFYEKVLN